MRAWLKIAGLGCVFLFLLPLQWVALKARWRLGQTIPIWFHRAALRVLSVRVRQSGPMPDAGPVLIVSNHLSWIDICAIGAALPVHFIAKSDVAGWPVFGTLARLQRTVFVDRTRRMATAEAAQDMSARLNDGAALVLFAEGTTNDGQRILPFRSALVGAGQQAAASGEGGVRLQALTVAYVAKAGMPLARNDLPEIAWHGDMELPPHLMARLRGAPIEARLHWGRTYVIGRDGDRKAVTQAVEQEVRAAYAALRTGRDLACPAG